MKILVINPLWPRPSHSALSANVVFYELIRNFAWNPDTEVSFLKINQVTDPPLSDEEKNGIELMKNEHVKILEPICLPPSPRRKVLSRILQPRLSDFYPDIIHRNFVYEYILRAKPDVIFIPWAEATTALCADLPILKFAYYGSPDDKQALAMAEFDFRHGQSNFFKYRAQQRYFNYLEHFHLEEIKKYEILGSVAANFADYYRRNGHPNAFYIQNIWIDRFTNWREKRKDIPKNSIPKIIANIGRLSHTANTHGLEILGRDVLPSLRRVMGKQPFELHLYGAGELHSAVAPLLKAPEVHLRGFVNDIDHELLSGDIFLCLNNAGPFKVCHTRYLHAWSLGCCVVGHSDTVLSMPEMQHGKNALLADTPDGIAEIIKAAIEDQALRNTIGERGYQTFREYYTAEKVAPKILQSMMNYQVQHAPSII